MTDSYEELIRANPFVLNRLAATVEKLARSFPLETCSERNFCYALKFNSESGRV